MDWAESIDQRPTTNTPKNQTTKPPNHQTPNPPPSHQSTNPPPSVPLFEAIRLALAQIRVQKLKSFFTLLGVTISVMFLIAVVSIVEGMNKYVEEDFAGKWLGVSTFNVRPPAAI